MMKSTGELSADTLNELAQVPFDDVLDALGHIQRRKLLFALLEHNPQDDSPADLADSEDNIDGPEGLVAMHHVHLPKLVEYGYINWKQDTHEVTQGPNFDAIQPLLELLADHEDELPDDWL